VGAVIEAAMAATAVIAAEFRARTTVIATGAAVVLTGRATGPGAAVVLTGRAAWTWAAIALGAVAWGTVGAGAAWSIRARAARAGRPGATVILTGATGWAAESARTAGAGATVILTRAAGRAAESTGAAGPAGTTRTGTPGAVLAKPAAIPARASATTTAAISLSLATAPGFPFVIRSPAPDDFAGGGLALLQIADPVGSEVQIQQLGEVDGFWIRHVGRR